jgi:hypothetical protein
MEHRRVFGITSPICARAVLQLGVVFLSVLLALSWFTAGPALAQSVSLSSTSGPPGTSVTVSGSGFTAGDTYQITFAPGTIYEYLLVPTTNISGTSFSVSITIPPAPRGSYTININTNRWDFNPTFQITPQIVLTANAGFDGNDVTASGQGFRAESAINIIFNGSTVASTTSDTSGEFNAVDFLIPSLPRGQYNVYASDVTGSSPNVAFTILPYFTISPAEGPVGTQLELGGTGFARNNKITIYWDSLTITSNIVTGSTGSFTATIAVPETTRGAHVVIAKDVGGGSSRASFMVRPTITITPASGSPGTLVQVTGTGFLQNATVRITYNNVIIATHPPAIMTDTYGGFSASFTVPSIVSGNYTVGASDSLSSVTTIFNIAANLVINPVTGNVGSELFVGGAGFTPGGHVSLSYDSQSLVTVTADSAGAFSANFTAPVSPAGQHTISARDLNAPAVMASTTFTMESTPPPEPSLLTPESGIQADTLPLFSWSPVTDPSGVTYILQVARDAAFSQLIIVRQGLTQPQYRPADSERLALTKKDSPYYWRVQAVDGAGNASSWTTGSFYTQDSTPPNMPALLSPPDASQDNVLPDFTWSAASDPSGVTYNLQVALDAAFSRLVIFKQGLTQPEYQVTQAESLQLTKKTAPYYWRVQAVDGAGNAGNWTAAGSFYTQDSTPPPVPAPLSPANGSQTSAAVSFDWTDVSDPSGVTYTIEVAQDSGFVHLVVDREGLDKSSYTLLTTEELAASTGKPPSAYYWRVRATDGTQNVSDWSVTDTFYVRGFQLRGWLLAAVLVIGGVLVLAAGIFIGMKIGPARAQQSRSPKNDGKGGNTG